jgi:hypothetical protein
MFQVGDLVEKYTGDYRAPGEVRAVFTVWDGGRCDTWFGTTPRAAATFATSTARPICAKLSLHGGRKATRRLMREAARS